MLEVVPPLLPRFHQWQQQIDDAQRIAKIILEGGEIESKAGELLRQSADGHNRDRRRGLPVISRGITGTAPGTDPLGALLAKERRSEPRR